jgi:hypothetical protein
MQFMVFFLAIPNNLADTNQSTLRLMLNQNVRRLVKVSSMCIASLGRFFPVRGEIETAAGQPQRDILARFQGSIFSFRGGE